MLYYRLTNFYQNHRRYVKSVDEGQLKGQNKSASQLESDGGCTPLTTAPNGKPYYPCGLIANSMFNGTLLMNFRTNKTLSLRQCCWMSVVHQLQIKRITWLHKISRGPPTLLVLERRLIPMIKLCHRQIGRCDILMATTMNIQFQTCQLGMNSRIGCELPVFQHSVNLRYETQMKSCKQALIKLTLT